MMTLSLLERLTHTTGGLPHSLASCALNLLLQSKNRPPPASLCLRLKHG